MSRRLPRSLPMLAAATVLCVMAAGQAHPAGRADAGSSAQARRGGTLRLGGLLDVDPVDPAIAYLPGAWQIEYATCAKLFNYPDAVGRGGDAARPRGRRPVHGLEGRTDLHLHVEEDVPLPHRRTGDGPELRVRAQPGREPDVELGRNRVHARDRRRCRGDGRDGAVDLGCARARPLPAPDPADQTGRRFHRPPHDAVLLPDPRRHAARSGGGRRDRRPRRLGSLLRRRASRQPANRPEAQRLLPWHASRERRRGRVDDREGRRLPGRRRGGPPRLLRRRSTRDRIPDSGRDVRHQPARRAVLRRSFARHVVPRLQPRSACVQGSTWRSRSRRRSTSRSTGRRWHARLATSRASAPTR